MTFPTLPANWTDGGPLYHASNQNLVETTVNSIGTAVEGLQSTQLSRLTIVITTAITLSAGTTVTLTTGGTVALPAICDITAFIESGGAPSLPTAVGNTNRYNFIDASGGNATVAAAISGQLINGSALPYTLPASAAVGCVSDNTQYWIT